jgi:hypothetical protein
MGLICKMISLLITEWNKSKNSLQVKNNKKDYYIKD